MRSLFLSVFLVLVTFIIKGQESNFLATIENKSTVRELSLTFPELDIEIAFPSSKQKLFQSVYRIKTNGEESEDVFAALLEHKGVKNIEEETPIQTLQAPNDYTLAFGNDYALNLINAEGAWDITTGDSSIKIGISDSNFDLDHEELIGAYTTNVNNFFHSNINHGTAVAITASGNTNNGVGKSAIGYNTKMRLDFMSFNGLLDLSYAGVQVVNASWASGCVFNNYHQQLINEIYDNGTIIVASAGNGSSCYGPESLVYPAAYNHVISVSSIGPNDNHERIPGDVYSTHQHNDSVHLVAPGYDVGLGIANNNYTTGNGTSFAAPYVSGTIGLMLSVNPCLTYEDVLVILQETAVDIDALNPVYAGFLGAGRLDAAAAVEMANNYASFNFEMTSAYNCINDEYLLTIIPDDYENGVSIEWENGSTDWSLANQQEDEYEFIIKRPFGCDIDTSVYYIPSQPIYDYTSSVSLNYGHTTLHDFNGDGVIRIKGLLIVESGVTYNLSNKNIEFGINNNMPVDLGFQKSGIVVKPGGKLTIDNCDFDAVENCNTEWDGIELWGQFKDTIIEGNIVHYSKNSDDSKTDLTVLNSTLSNASTGISNHRSIQPFGTASNEKEICGSVTVINSAFLNNNVGINLKKNHKEETTHLISNADFIADNQIGATHIKLANINKLDIIDSHFEGNTNTQLVNQGSGIVGEKSSINAKKAYAQIFQNTNNSFENLFEGIKLSNNQESECLFVGKDIFTNVQRGIYINGNVHTVIDRTTFNLPSGTSSENSFALMTKNTNQIKLVNNTLNGSESAGQTYGFVIKDSYEYATDIINNSFNEELNTAIHFEGVNHNVSFSCNSFDITGDFDLAIAEGSFDFKEGTHINYFSTCGKINANIANDVSNSDLNYNTFQDTPPICVTGGVNVITQDLPLNFNSICDNKDNIARIDPIDSDDYDLDNNNSTNDDDSQILNINYISSSIQQTENSENNKLSVYPNPNRGDFTIESKNVSLGNEVIIYNQMGAIVKTDIITSKTSSYTINNLEKGTYTIVTYNQNNELQRGKVVVL